MNEIKDLTLRNSLIESKNNEEELKSYYYRVIHDIKAPIASIIGLVTLTQIETKNKKSQAFLKEIENHFRSLETEISASLRNGLIFNENLSSEEVDFKEILSEVIKLLTFSRKLDAIHFRIEIKQSRNFKINRQLIFSIFQNIIDNSIKHGRDSDEKELNMRIRIKQLKRSIKIEVEDDGKGVSENIKAKLFEKFNSSNDLLLIGSGLGLYIIKKSVDKLNGQLIIDSKHGKGTKFMISIPEA